MESILSVEIICCFSLMSNRPKTMSHIRYIFQKKNTPHSPTSKNWIAWVYHVINIAYKSIYQCIQMRTFFSEISPWELRLENQHAYYAHRNALSSYELICLTRQKYKVEQLPVLWNMENKSRQNVCLASCITSEFSRCISHSRQLESRRSTITIENQLYFFDYFYNKIIYMENFWLGFVKVLSTH